MLHAFDNSVIFRRVWFRVLAVCVCVFSEGVGGGSLCNLKGKYKAHTKLGAQAERQGSRKGKER